MKSPYAVLRSKDKGLHDWLYVVAGAVAAYVFIGHGLECIFQSKSLLPVTAFVGMDDATGLLFMKFVGIVDLTVGILLAVKPFKLLMAYAALWVLVPLYLQYQATGELEIVAKVMLWVALAYYVFYENRMNRAQAPAASAGQK